MIDVRPSLTSTVLKSYRASYVGALRNVFAGLIFFSALNISYILFVSDSFAYLGFKREVDPFRIVVASLGIIAIGATVRRREDVVSFFQLIAFLAYFCPAMVIFSIGGALPDYFWVVITAFFLLYFFSSLPIKRTVVGKSGKRTILVACAAITCSTSLAIFLLGGGAYFSLDFLSVYEFRDVAAETLPAIFAYIISPVSKVILPIGIVMAIYFRNLLFVVIFLCLGVLLFGLTHHKSIFAIPFGTVVLYLALSRFGIGGGLRVIFYFIAFVAAVEAVVLELFFPNTLGPISTFLVRRVFLIPPLLDSYYVEYFSENTFFFWAVSRITFGLVETDYAVSAPFLIGLEFFGAERMSANSGFIGSGFSNAGIFGVAIYAILTGLIISALNALGRRIGGVIVICVSFPVVLTALTTSDLITVFLTHGLAVLFVMLSFMPRMQTK